MYFRFFVPEEMICQPLLAIVRPFYGSPSLFLSTIDPKPDFSIVDGWKQVFFLFVF